MSLGRVLLLSKIALEFDYVAYWLSWKYTCSSSLGNSLPITNRFYFFFYLKWMIIILQKKNIKKNM